jgi:hypothetical protein
MNRIILVALALALASPTYAMERIAVSSAYDPSLKFQSAPFESHLLSAKTEKIPMYVVWGTDADGRLFMIKSAEDSPWRCIHNPHRDDRVCDANGEIVQWSRDSSEALCVGRCSELRSVAPSGEIPDAMEIIGGSKRADELPFSPTAEAIDSELGEDQL